MNTTPAASGSLASRERAIGTALSAIARAVGTSLDVKDVFRHVADAARQVLPFDTMGVSVARDDAVSFDDVENVRLSVFAVAGDAQAEEIGEYRRADVSPALRVEAPGRVSRHADVLETLDPAFLLDRRVRALDCRSLMVCLLPADRPLGSIWFSSPRPNAFAVEDEPTVLAIAELVALAVQHDRLYRNERERRRRSEALEALLPTLSKALDIREVFDQLSSAVGPILPHDRMALGLFSDDRRSVRVHAYSGERVPGMLETIRVDCEASEPDTDWSFFLVRDLRQEPSCCGTKYEMLKDEGLRSLLRVPVHLNGEVVGGLNFLSNEIGRYREEDADIARRIADQVALVLSHERLAEEARLAAAAREEAQRLEGRLAELTEQLSTYLGGTQRIIGRSKSWRAVLDLVSKVAPTDTTVLLTGESGTGKEVVARAIHAASPRSGRPFLAINCAALPEQLLESELFGHERGAFTGAVQPRAGKIEQAAGGVLFLDEVAEMSPAVQAKFLRVLQEREFQRLGGSRVMKADVRVVAATNRNLETALARGDFREDLFYRLSVFGIALPPLRDRKEDILALAAAFAEEIGKTVSRPCAGISKQGREALLAYSWPGNVRELRNAIERAIILCDGGLITAEHLPAPRAESEENSGRSPANARDLLKVERDLVTNALKEARNNKARAARLLGITRSQLYSRIQKYGIPV